MAFGLLIFDIYVLSGDCLLLLLLANWVLLAEGIAPYYHRHRMGLYVMVVTVTW
jgi:hypothetical protein